MSKIKENRISKIKNLIERGIKFSKKAQDHNQKLNWEQHYPQQCRKIKGDLRRPVKVLKKELRKKSYRDLAEKIENSYSKIKESDNFSEYEDGLKELEETLEDLEIQLEDLEGSIKIDLEDLGIENIREEVRGSIKKDAKELNRCADSRCWKAVCMLSGRIIESLFIEVITLYVEKGGTSKKAKDIVKAIEGHNQKNLGYQRLKNGMSDAGLLDTSGLADNYFELIMAGRHPSVHFRDRDEEIKIDKKAAKVVISSTEALILNTINFAERKNIL